MEGGESSSSGEDDGRGRGRGGDGSGGTSSSSLASAPPPPRLVPRNERRRHSSGRKRRRRTQETPNGNNSSDAGANSSDANATNNGDGNDDVDDKSYRICSVLGGLDVARYVSSNARRFFEGAVEDVELIREYVSEAALNGGIAGGLHSLRGLDDTCDWRGRGFSQKVTGVQAGIGYSDDRRDRRIDRIVIPNNKNRPLMGDKQTDMAIVDAVSLLFPWIVDRKSLESKWWIDHQNGRSEGPDREPFLFDVLYAAAWIGSYGEAWAYYPPFNRMFGQPFTIGDVTGNDYDSHDQPFVRPNLPGGSNVGRRAAFSSPYPDQAQTGLSLITAMAPIYFTGQFGNYTYNDTYIGCTGLDIAVASVSSLLDVLEDTLTNRSFGMLVDATNFKTIVISQSVVERIYPPRTGFEDFRVTYDITSGTILEDRRNKMFLVSDTIHGDLTQLTNADWSSLLEDVRTLRPGERDFSTLNLTLTGEESGGPVEFLVMYERWKYVANWALLAFAPKREVEKAMRVRLTNAHQNESSIILEGERGCALNGEAVLVNAGTLDVAVTLKSLPDWMHLDQHIVGLGKEFRTLKAKQTLPVTFNVTTDSLDFGISSVLLTFNVRDDDYPDCFYNEDVSLPVKVKVTPKDCFAATGDKLRRADADGNCVCKEASLEIDGRCVRLSVLLPSILIPLFVVIGVCVYLYVEHRRKLSDSVWDVKTSELKFDDPPVCIGRGTFGLVLLAEYRGTQVAVKRVIPPREISRERKAMGSVIRRLSMLGGGGLQSATSVTGTGGDASLLFDFDNQPPPPSSSQQQRGPRSHQPASAPLTQRAANGHHSAPATLVHDAYDGDDDRDNDDDSDGDGGDDDNSLPLSWLVSAPLATASASLLTVSGAVGRTVRRRWSLFNRSVTGLGRKSNYQKLKDDFVHEMRHLSKLRHPCITTVMGAVLSRGEEPLLVMEYMDQGSLFDLLHNDSMVLEGYLVLPILRDVARGVRFLHAATPQVVHGDLKAQNVLVDSKFRAKVADFGLSQKKQVGATGTPLWMAPELLRGESENTAMSDIYSLGIILYEVYSRKIPYHDKDGAESTMTTAKLRETLRLVCDPKVNKRPPIPESMPAAVAALMTELLAADPAKRPSCDEVDSRLKAFDVENVEPGEMHFSMQARKYQRESAMKEKLLLDIFPKHVADALAHGRKVEPEHFDVVTIFFSDIVGFTTISHSMTPQKVSDMLDRLYTKFDALSHEHHVFKIETIGDAWMGVTNISEDQTSDHARRIAEFSIDAVKAADETLVDADDPSRGFVQIRVGFHSGPVLANVVGSRNPKYTIIGDTVNTASRMESNSLPGRIQCSDVAANHLMKQAPDLPLVHRGKISVKGKGEMDAYWVNEVDNYCENTEFSPDNYIVGSLKPPTESAKRTRSSDTETTPLIRTTGRRTNAANNSNHDISTQA